MEEKEIVRKSVPIPNKWLKELLDFLGIEDRHLAWMLFPHVQNRELGFHFSEDRIKEIVREIYHPTEEELKQEDEWEKELIEEVGYSKMDFLERGDDDVSVVSVCILEERSRPFETWQNDG